MRGIGIALTATALVLSQLLTAPKHGAIVLVGGGKIPSEAVSWLKQRVNHGTYLVISYNPENRERWEEMFDNVTFVLPEKFEKHSLFNVGAIIIEGGDQWQYLNRLSGKAIQNAHERGIPIMGTSAGAMILGEHYFSAENGTISSDEIFECGNKMCLGKRFVTIQCLKGLIVDTHFEERNRNGRLRAFIEKSGAMAGLGIDEGTALCIDNKESLIVGKGGVKIIHNTFADN